MRAEFAQSIIALHKLRADLVFLTADLGYMALEEVGDALGERFVNTGVAEQNAISLAAGLAKEGQLPFFYSMAAFSTLRPYAQIRDNVCLHRLPVKLVGNGGGYGYGIMGATHHALEDIAVMRALPHMKLYIPLVGADLPEVLSQMAADPGPNYLRLNRAAKLRPLAPFAPYRKLKSGHRAVVISTGPVIQELFDLDTPELLEGLEVWTVGKFPLEEFPLEMSESLARTRRVLTFEEHREAGGLGEAISHRLLTEGFAPLRFLSLAAAGYPSGRYGSQQWHQEESGLRGAALVRNLEEFLRG